MEFVKTDYFDIMTINEIQQRTNFKCTTADDIQRYYINRLKKISLYEQEILNKCMRLVNDLVRYKLPVLGKCFNKVNIRIYKIEKDTDWNYEYTIESAIILSEKFINDLINCVTKLNYDISLIKIEGTVNNPEHWNSVRPHIRPLLKYITVLCHETIHIMQRNKLFNFDELYKTVWNMYKINPGNIIGNYFNVLTNPDAYNFEWIIFFENKWLMPLTIFNANYLLEPVNILCEINLMKSGNIELTKNWTPVSKYPKFKQAFYNLNQGHPNEISAYILSSWIVEDTNLCDETNWYHNKDIFKYIY